MWQRRGLRMAATRTPVLLLQLPRRRCQCSALRRRLSTQPSDSSPTPTLATRIRARALSALQKDGATEIDASLPLGQTFRRIFSAARPELPLLAGAAVGLVISSYEPPTHPPRTSQWPAAWH